MGISVEYNNFFAYSSKRQKYFNTTFSKGINIVHGKNTSGKSTFIQALLYTFGINDEKRKLADLLKDDVIFRVDLTIYNPTPAKVSIVRDDEIVSIKVEQKPPVKFIGISGNNSKEHIKLKTFLSALFGFTLHLEYDNEYKPASLEAMFLPYYIAQDVGWVYRHKSFRGLDFVKNFKNDFFDYLLGIVNNYDRLEKSKLEKEKKDLEAESRLLNKIEQKDKNLKLAKLQDEVFTAKTIEYINPYKENKSRLIELEKEYLSTCNKITLLEESRKVLLKIRRSLSNDILANTKCPTCSNELSHSVEDTYNYLQDLNDTEKQLEELNKNIKELKNSQGKLNSIINEINKNKEIIENEYYELLEYKVDNVTFESWLKNKVNIALSGELNSKLGEITSNIYKIEDELSQFKTDDAVRQERRIASLTFKSIFQKYASELKIKPFEDERFYLLYDIPAFPRQGVELLKTLLAYNFSFIEIIKRTEHTHVLPFIMDAIFEGDFEDESKNEILSFIREHASEDQQLIFSIADSKSNTTTAATYNQNHFENKAKLICIGENTWQRSFLTKYNGEYEEYINETMDILI
ncbi:chromosome segregation protein [Plesiomonas shigelloides]|uniref:AAA family ATPase n=1 Tax=Plesiomonas shigelloides TaxID=703 RepID=UPI000D8D38E6|nr:AAA family ATPase [Plesiomonas shigelloides]SPZ45908.1 chromosome segregation protein [Plesiomonas shigelloides]